MTDPRVDRRGFLRQLGMGAALAPAWNARSYLAIPGANERLLVGVIGCGGMGNSHLRALLAMQDSANVRVAAVCDVFRKRLDAAAAQTAAKAYSKYRTLLSQKELDYVLIATPEHWHHRMALDALEAGKHVYLEKPLTQTIRQAKEVVRRVQRSKLKLQVGVQGMSDESYEVAGRYIREGVLGKVVMAQIDYSRNYTDDFWAYDIDPDANPRTNLDWAAWQGPAPKRPWDPRRFFQWRRYWDYSGGIATDLFIHRVTRIIKAAGLTFPDRVVASGGTWQFTRSVAQIPDTFNMLCDYPGGPDGGPDLLHGQRFQGRPRDSRPQSHPPLHQGRLRDHSSNGRPGRPGSAGRDEGSGDLVQSLPQDGSGGHQAASPELAECHTPWGTAEVRRDAGLLRHRGHGHGSSIVPSEEVPEVEPQERSGGNGLKRCCRAIGQ